MAALGNSDARAPGDATSTVTHHGQCRTRDQHGAERGPSRPDACIVEVEATSLKPLTKAAASDPVRRQHDVFLSGAALAETAAAKEPAEPVERVR